MRNKVLRMAFLATVTIAAVALLAVSGAAQMMKKPPMVTLKGSIIDLTCASKGKVLMGNWYNAENDDHMTPQGKKENCATMCLKGGQPAALFAKNRIQAVFACNPAHTLAAHATETVEVQGFWSGDGKNVKAFVPMKIRAGSGNWSDVKCDIMHN